VSLVVYLFLKDDFITDRVMYSVSLLKC